VTNAAQSEGKTARWLAEVVVVPKPGVSDPEGSAILGGLHQLGFEGVRGVRAGRFFEVEVEAEDEAAARSALAAMCDRLLANPVIEAYQVEVRSEGTVDEPFPLRGGGGR